MSPASETGQVVTFYSYKGGTGRSMLLANVAWILASNGHKVLAVDWDLEAPGLHRYFSPFLLDKELTDSDGVIDFVVDFAVAATTAADQDGEQDEDWYLPYADITSYASTLQWDFASEGVLDFIGAGRQGASYSTRVNGFGWQDFYQRFGGGSLIDEARRVMKERYEYILIDSRTGVSDASGICTVQLPDVLVVLFTLNNQSIDGASGVARSVQAQRGDSLTILPVPTRIENAEKDKRDLRRERAMRQFGTLLHGTDQEERMAYWGDVAVLYEPYYAYEELMAAFRDEPGSAHSILASAEHLTRRIAGRNLRAVRINPQLRAVVLASYEGTAPPQPEPAAASVRGGVYVAYRRRDSGRVAAIYDALAASLGSDRVFMDVGLAPGVDFVEGIEHAIQAAEVVLVVIGPDWISDDTDDLLNVEVAAALVRNRRVIPVLVGRARMPSASELPERLRALTRRQAIELSDERWDYDTGRLLAAIEVATARTPATAAYQQSAPEQLAPSAASDAVIGRVLKTRGVNWVAIAIAVVSLSVTIVLFITQFTR
ncbi:MAG: TIR domain-containing protein [Thermoleophilaceae bacterium]